MCRVESFVCQRHMRESITLPHTTEMGVCAVFTFCRVSEIEHPTDDPTPPLSKLECIGIATGCFVLARCMQLGNAVVKDEAKAMTYYHKVSIIPTILWRHDSSFFNHMQAKRMDKSVTIELHSQLTQNQL